MSLARRLTTPLAIEGRSAGGVTVGRSSIRSTSTPAMAWNSTRARRDKETADQLAFFHWQIGRPGFRPNARGTSP